ncbi:MAG: GGDEF domain-containing protein [Bdellovibrionales bacterium]|jgi:two-component system, cell cycle response regulator|nr:GGDEF domain-containing protein [Bdellovibrionales bacterium]MBT3525627.1 GGDEF domain-containing protein [Bdellovibrionales bacterium]MBT7668352.1 GGDEF domain-containing protein [Bdellovibrionales bacterium]MBT7766341.1 GGDEF domain-containing protein [Bdellovibrionales bacterium]
MNNPNDPTVVLTDINAALSSSEQEAEAADRPAALLVVGGDLNGTIFNLFPGDITVGRNADNLIPLEFQGISRYHMTIVVSETDEQVTLNDGGSKNGTYLNNKRLIDPQALEKGDIIKIGSMALKYLPKGDPERLTYDKLNYEANVDAFTGCYNKTYFNNTCSREVKKSKVTGHPLSLMLFDLDHFKKVNDNFGHDAGDYVLKELADLIREHGAREMDTFARYGGEEFVILLPKTTIKQAYEIAERIRKSVEEHSFVYEEDTLPITISVGIADYREGVDNGTDLFKRADKAVYGAKNEGRNRVAFFRE